MVKVSSRALSKGPEGEYVPGLPSEYVAEKYGVALTDIAKLASAENPHGASPKALEAVEKARDRIDLYPDWTAKALRTAIGEKYGFDPDGVVCGSGETEVISMVLRVFAGPSDSVLMHEPCFPIYHLYANCEGRNPVFVRMGEDFDPVVDNYIEALKQKPRIAFVTNPHNPTGRFLEEAELRRICDAADKETLVVLDEAYIHYSETEGGMHLLHEYDNLIVLRTMSKAFGLAGLRVGFGISANKDLIRPMWKIKPTWNMGQMQIAGGVAGINDDEHVQRAVKTVVEMRSYVEAKIAQMNSFRVVPGSRANFFLLEILDPDLTSTALFHALLKRGVIVKDGLDIEGLGDRFMRVDVNLKKHMDRLVSALSDIENADAA